jgi:acetolactate synthase-1/2/3 large subunit
MNPGRCAYEVGRFLATEGRDWTVVLDGGDAAEWMRAAAVARRPGQLLMYGPLGTIGTGAGFSVGAWVANGRSILYYTGDGSFGFYPLEFDTFCRYDIPVVCVISNDSAWGMIKHAEATRRPEQAARSGVGWELAHMRAYERLADMWEGVGVRVARPEEIVPAIKRAADSGRPAIVNVETDKVHTSPYMASLGYGASQT